MSDDHHNDHAHPADEDAQPLTRYQVMEIALRELLIEKGVVTRDEIRAGVERIDSLTPQGGARVVARAWCDPAFKELLLSDAPAACRELGIDIGPTNLVVVENTEDQHNVIVCTLCSCYPRMLLGLPPSWYKSREYRARVVREPRAVLAEFDTVIADDVRVRVHDSTADLRYLVLPRRPAGTEALDEEQLAALVTRDCMIGVSIPTISGTG